MIDYRAPVADLLFTLEHVAEAGRLAGWDAGLAAEVLAHGARWIDDTIAPLDPIGDIEGCRLEQGRVRMPAAFVAAYRQYAEGGWPGLALPDDLGGQGLSPVLAAAVSEMLSGACLSFQMVTSLVQSGSRAILVNGSDAQRRLWIPRLAAGEWLTTMCLTEPQAGSDLSLVRTTAAQAEDGAWLLTGGKIFISGGDQDMTGKVLHLVLARTGDAASGTKGLSLFLCPSEFEDGRRNEVSVLRLEEKMGMHASPTCQMAFEGARAEIVGAPGQGLACMFTMMNAQRLDVAVTGVGIADVAGQRSRAYAGERRQGRIPGEPGTAPIARHADVRRMLLRQMALALGGRAMTWRALVELELDPKSPLIDILTPVCKAFCTEAAFEAADLAIQIHGGYGFLREYRVEQLLRDVRITRIYEGTNGIQAMTLAGRLLRDSRALDAFAADVAAAAAGAPELTAALDVWRRATGSVAAHPDVGAVADPYMRLTGLVAFGAAWARLETAAAHAPLPERITTVAAFVRTGLLADAQRLAALCAAPPLAALSERVFEAT